MTVAFKMQMQWAQTTDVIGGYAVIRTADICPSSLLQMKYTGVVATYDAILQMFVG